MILNIGTPCGLYPHNLHLVKESIFDNPFMMLPDFRKNFDIRWHVAIDTLICKKEDIDINLFNYMDSFTETEDGCWGNQCKNALMENVKEGWVYLCDDDNIIHTDLYTHLLDVLDNSIESEKFITFKHDTGFKFMKILDRESRYSKPIINKDGIQESTCDSGQVVFHSSEWKPWEVSRGLNKKLYPADHRFYQNAYIENEDNFYISDHLATFYNRLKW
tara:strand:- start:107 stop:760 length:654 start_codon:yes stop_codon:yes gene_type:complete